MIKVSRGNKPKYLDSNIVGLAVEKMEEFYTSKNRGQKRYDFPFNREIDNELKVSLHETFHGKCGYCETRIESPEKGTVDRFRPNNGVRDKKEYYQDLYWWLNLEWSNLIYCCKECNQYKANYFPILGVRVFSREESLNSEQPQLLNPCDDNPDQHFVFDYKGNIGSETEKGHQTIELIRLNRTNLLSRRINTRIHITNLAAKLLDHGKTKLSPRDFEYLHNIYEEDPRVEYLSLAKSVLHNEIETYPQLIELLGFEQKEESNRIKNFEEFKSTKEITNTEFIQNDFFPIEFIEIKDFKGISHIKIDFEEDPLEKKSWLFLLGENGVGKSSILQAIAVGLSADKRVLNKQVVPSLIKKRKQKANIIIKERNSNNIIKTTLVRKNGSIIQEGKFNSFVIGYGSLRLSSDVVKENPKRDLNKISYKNLFNPITALNDVTTWLQSTYSNDPDLFDRIAFSIKQLLPHDFENNELTVHKGEIMFKDSEVLFSQLSDGFKSTIILAVDIMMKLSSAHSDMDKMSGIVLIDELGNQLHPRWQMRIVEQLRGVFKNINFIISTHHPLCLRGSEQGEILLLRNINKEITPITELPDPSLLRVDQILASEFFGLNSLVDPKLEAKFNQYHSLLANQEDLTPEERTELNDLKDDLREQKQLGASLREELMYTVIDKLLAEKLVYNREPMSRQELKKEAVDRVSAIWSKLNTENHD
ncbi:MAG: AAA family ATPase [Flavobacteriales bacterium]|nr:AAA family ATPase [Flavobacteriales bacterium]